MVLTVSSGLHLPLKTSVYKYKHEIKLYVLFSVNLSYISLILGLITEHKRVEGSFSSSSEPKLDLGIRRRGGWGSNIKTCCHREPAWVCVCVGIFHSWEDLLSLSNDPVKLSTQTFLAMACTEALNEVTLAPGTSMFFSFESWHLEPYTEVTCSTHPSWFQEMASSSPLSLTFPAPATSEGSDGAQHVTVGPLEPNSSSPT